MWKGEIGGQLEPRFVTFDFGDTLVSSEPSYLARTALGLQEMGVEVSEEEVKRAYFEADIRAAEELLRQAPFPPEVFREVFGRYFFELLGIEERALEIGPVLMQKLIEHRPARVMVPGAREVLEELHERGYGLGIISNNDGFTRQKCAAVGIEGYFAFILDSTLEGVMKPDPRLFQKAVQLAGVKPEQILHVGDLWGCDIMGAWAVGIPAGWLANELVSPEPLPGTWRIGNLRELLKMIKL